MLLHKTKKKRCSLPDLLAVTSYCRHSSLAGSRFFHVSATRARPIYSVQRQPNDDIVIFIDFHSKTYQLLTIIGRALIIVSSTRPLSFNDRGTPINVYLSKAHGTRLKSVSEHLRGVHTIDTFWTYLNLKQPIIHNRFPTIAEVLPRSCDDVISNA